MQAMAKMGTTKGSHTKVKEFSKELTTAHTALMTRIKELATKKGAPIPTAMEKDDRLKLDAIEKLSGLTFDKRFMKEVADEHEDMIENYEEAIRESKDADVKSFAEKSLPGIRDHLAKAKTIVSELEGSASK
jgi:putative membrane protein